MTGKTRSSSNNPEASTSNPQANFTMENEPPTWLNGFLEHQERMRIEERQRYEAIIGALVVQAIIK